MESFFSAAIKEYGDRMSIREEWAIAFLDGEVDQGKVDKTKESCRDRVLSQAKWVKEKKYIAADINVRDCEYEDRHFHGADTVIKSGCSLCIMYNKENTTSE